MMVSTYDREVVAVSMVEQDVDPETNFLAVACRSRSASACSLSRSSRAAGTRRHATTAFSSVASVAVTRGIEPLLWDLDVDGRKGDDVRWHENRRRGCGGNQGVEPLLENPPLVGGRATMSDDRKRRGHMNSTPLVAYRPCCGLAKAYEQDRRTAAAPVAAYEQYLMDRRWMNSTTLCYCSDARMSNTSLGLLQIV
jgi:hypothetical protein